jgi:plasmid stabilization system protein ParE
MAAGDAKQQSEIQAFRVVLARGDPMSSEFAHLLTLSPAVYKQYRRALMHRFPYAIFYKEEPDAIKIYAVSHTSQHPRKWRKQLP